MPAIGSVNVRVSATTGGLTSGLTSATTSISAFGNKIQGVANNALGGFASGLKSTASGVTSLASSLGGLAIKAGLVGGSFLAVKSAFGAVGNGIADAASMEQAEISFGVLFKSTETAKKVLGDLSQFAADTPFELPELTNAARSLAAFGTAATDIVPTMRMIGDVASGIGQPIGEIAELYGKAKVQGRLFGEDINQLTGRGIPVISELAKVLGVSESQVKQLVSEGKVGFPQLQQAFQNMTSSGGMFQGMMEKQSKSYAGMWSTLADNVSGTFRDIAGSLMEAFNVKSIMTSLIEFTGTVKTGFASIVPVIQSVAGVIGAAWDVGIAYASAIFETFGATTTTTFADVKTNAIAALDWIKSGLESLKPTAIAVGNVVGAIWTTIASGAKVAFDFITTTGMTLWTNIAAVFTSISESSGMSFANISETAFSTVANVIGFFYNLGTNLTTIWTWMGSNWQNLLTDMVNLSLTVAANSLQNYATLFKGMYRVAVVWQGWTLGLFQRLFSFEIVDTVLTGLITIGESIRKWASAAWDTITSIFSRKAPSGALDAFINQARSDLQMGMDNIDISASLGTVLQDTAAELVGPLEGFQSTLTSLPEIKVDIPGLKQDLKAISEATPPQITPPQNDLKTPPPPKPPYQPPTAEVKTPRTVEALNRGSSAATSAVLQASANTTRDKTPREQLREQTLTNKYLARLANQPQTEIVAGKV